MSIESARFEGYGPAGSAVIVDSLTDNRTRTVAELRHVFTKFGGYLGAPGSVAYLFKPVGRMIFAHGTDMARLTRLGFGAGAEDILLNSAGSIEVLTDPVELNPVRAQLSSVGFEPECTDFIEHASVSVPLAGAAAVTLRALIQALRALDDVQDVYSNAEISDSFVAQF